MPGAEANITLLLERWRSGQQDAFAELAPAVYDRLHGVAAAYLTGESRNSTLQATALVNETFIRLLQNQNVQYSSREHFYVFAAKVMRRILVDHARASATQKRGEHPERVILAPELAWVDAASPEYLDLEIALDELGAADPEKLRTIELRFFLGATADETGELLGHSRARVNRDVNFAVSWLHKRLKTLRPEQISDDSRQVK
ncbi:MAG: sigma-70 family RNA polymerase sigma factor [Acidobacteria bacterium]|nr:sigma-70 family RNA polymerase sigma factor [Acidobacteriota bacterium]